jgi:hypothetical protein
MQHPNQRFTWAKQVLEGHIGAGLALVAAVVIVYHNALSAYFFDDDFQWLVGSWSFRPAQLVAFGSMSHFYRPVIDIYFAVMTPLLGGSPVRFHAASIVLHAANVLVVFALARRIYGYRWGPPLGGPSPNLYGFAAALFFADCRKADLTVGLYMSEGRHRHARLAHRARIGGVVLGRLVFRQREVRRARRSGPDRPDD